MSEHDIAKHTKKITGHGPRQTGNGNTNCWIYSLKSSLLFLPLPYHYWWKDGANNCAIRK